MPQQLFDHTYGASAPANYERFFVPVIGRPLAAHLIRAAALHPGERVLDVGCGTGIVARLALEQVRPGGAVAGLDVNPGMLAVAREVARPDTGIEWYEASADAIPLASESFDVVLCQFCLQFVSNRPVALREMRRVLVSGGRLALNLPGPIAPLFDAMARAMGRHIGPQAEGFVRAVFALHDEQELRQLLEAAGFSRVTVAAEVHELPLPAPNEFLWQYIGSTPLAAAVSGASDRVRSDLERDVVEEWRPFVTTRGMHYRQRIVTATARR